MEAVTRRLGCSARGGIVPPPTPPPLPRSNPLLSSQEEKPTAAQGLTLMDKSSGVTGSGSVEPCISKVGPPPMHRLGRHAGSASSPLLHPPDFEWSSSRDWPRQSPNMLASGSSRQVTGSPGTMSSSSFASPGLARCARLEGLFTPQIDTDTSTSGGASYATAQRELEGLAAKLKRQVANLQDHVHVVVQPLEMKLSSVAGRQPILEWQISEVSGSVRALQEEMRMHAQRLESSGLQLQNSRQLEETCQQHLQEKDGDPRYMPQSFDRRLAELEDKEHRAAGAVRQVQAALAKLMALQHGPQPGTAVTSPGLSHEEVQRMLDLLKGEFASSVEGIRHEVAGSTELLRLELASLEERVCWDGSLCGVPQPSLSDAAGPVGVVHSGMQLASWPAGAANTTCRNPPNNQELADLTHSVSQKLSALEDRVNGAFANALRECGPWMLRNLRHALQRSLQMSQDLAPSDGPQEHRAMPGVLAPEELNLQKTWLEDLDDFMGSLRCEIERAAGRCVHEELAAVADPLKQDVAAARRELGVVEESLREWVKSEVKKMMHRAKAQDCSELAQLVQKSAQIEAAVSAHDTQLLRVAEHVETVEQASRLEMLRFTGQVAQLEGIVSPQASQLLRIAERVDIVEQTNSVDMLRLADQVAQVEGVVSPQATELLRMSQRMTAIEETLAPQNSGVAWPNRAVHGHCMQQAPVHPPSLEEPDPVRTHQHREEPILEPKRLSSWEVTDGNGLQAVEATLKLVEARLSTIEKNQRFAQPQGVVVAKEAKAVSITQDPLSSLLCLAVRSNRGWQCTPDSLMASQQSASFCGLMPLLQLLLGDGQQLLAGEGQAQAEFDFARHLASELCRKPTASLHRNGFVDIHGLKPSHKLVEEDSAAAINYGVAWHRLTVKLLEAAEGDIHRCLRCTYTPAVPPLPTATASCQEVMDTKGKHEAESVSNIAVRQHAVEVLVQDAAALTPALPSRRLQNHRPAATPTPTNLNTVNCTGADPDAADSQDFTTAVSSRQGSSRACSIVSLDAMLEESSSAACNAVFPSSENGEQLSSPSTSRTAESYPCSPAHRCHEPEVPRNDALQRSASSFGELLEGDEEPKEAAAVAAAATEEQAKQEEEQEEHEEQEEEEREEEEEQLPNQWCSGGIQDEEAGYRHHVVPFATESFSSSASQPVAEVQHQMGLVPALATSVEFEIATASLAQPKEDSSDSTAAMLGASKASYATVGAAAAVAAAAAAEATEPPAPATQSEPSHEVMEHTAADEPPCSIHTGSTPVAQNNYLQDLLDMADLSDGERVPAADAAASLAAHSSDGGQAATAQKAMIWDRLPHSPQPIAAVNHGEVAATVVLEGAWETSAIAEDGCGSCKQRDLRSSPADSHRSCRTSSFRSCNENWSSEAGSG